MARTRSSTAHEKVLRAALSLFAERGIEATSMDAIAQASRVSKATIYNHWTDKEALLMEVMAKVHGLDREREDFDTGDICCDLTLVLKSRPPDDCEAERNRLMPAMIAYSATHHEFGKAWRRRVMEPARNAVQKILKRGIRKGLLLPGLDMEVACCLLLGPLLYAHIFSKEKGLPNAPDIGPASAQTFWRAHSQLRQERIEKAGIRKSTAKRAKTNSI